jgi:cytochrome c553
MSPIVLVLIAVSLPALLSAPPIHGAEQSRGEQIFRQRCASCHGAKGEGTKHYGKPLTGDRSVGQLAQFISQSMPPGPRKWVGEDARKVAAYIHDAFYSPLAQARNRPARIELSRLTVRQYRNAVADLVGSFRAPARWDDRRGLRGEYFKSRRFRTEDRVFERVDSEIRFDFGESGPSPDQFDPHQFSIRWKGGVLAPHTGEYEFILRTEHAARLWVNDQKQPLIDAWVKSGDGTEHRASLFLLGGRVYPLRLEFSKAGQGVDNSKKLKDRAVAKASLALEWNPPNRTAEVTPQRFLLPGTFPEIFAVAIPFPPDDRSMGYERGASVSKAWDDATAEAALETAGYVAAHLRQLSGVANDAPDRETRLREFSRQFAERAFRRPVTDEVQRFFIERQFQQAPDLETAVKRVVLLVLKSPRFLYRELGLRAPDSYDVAAYAGPNKSIAPIDSPYRMFGKLYGRARDQESLKSVLDDLKDDLNKVRSRIGAEDRQILDEHAAFVREMEQNLAANGNNGEHAVSALEPGVRRDNDNIPRISKLQMDLLVNGFAADLARVATLQYTNSVGQARMRWLGVNEGAPRPIA